MSSENIKIGADSTSLSAGTPEKKSPEEEFLARAEMFLFFMEERRLMIEDEIDLKTRRRMPIEDTAKNIKAANKELSMLLDLAREVKMLKGKFIYCKEGDNQSYFKENVTTEDIALYEKLDEAENKIQGMAKRLARHKMKLQEIGKKAK